MFYPLDYVHTSVRFMLFFFFFFFPLSLSLSLWDLRPKAPSSRLCSSFSLPRPVCGYLVPPVPRLRLGAFRMTPPKLLQYVLVLGAFGGFFLVLVLLCLCLIRILALTWMGTHSFLLGGSGGSSNHHCTGLCTEKVHAASQSGGRSQVLRCQPARSAVSSL